jgi:hypothetical protein
VYSTDNTEDEEWVGRRIRGGLGSVFTFMELLYRREKNEREWMEAMVFRSRSKLKNGKKMYLRVLVVERRVR